MANEEEFDRLRNAIIACVRARVGPDIPWNVIEECVDAALLRADKYDPTKGSPVAFFCQVAFNRVRDWIRRQRRISAFNKNTAQPPSQGGPVLEQTEFFRGVFLKAMLVRLSFPPEHRRLVWRLYMAIMSEQMDGVPLHQGEIAEEFGVSGPTVCRIKNAFHERMAVADYVLDLVDDGFPDLPGDASLPVRPENMSAPYWESVRWVAAMARVARQWRNLARVVLAAVIAVEGSGSAALQNAVLQREGEHGRQDLEAWGEKVRAALPSLADYQSKLKKGYEFLAIPLWLLLEVEPPGLSLDMALHVLNLTIAERVGVLKILESDRRI